MATWKYGPIKANEDWGMEFIEAEYSVEFNTTSDILSIYRKVNGEKTLEYIIGEEVAQVVGRMMVQWLIAYKKDKKYIESLLKENQNGHNKST